MATGTGPLPTQDLLNQVWNPAGTGPSPTGPSLSVYLLPGSGQTAPILGSGTFQGLGPNPLVVVQPAFRRFILDSAALGSASATGTNTTGLGGYKSIDVFARFSSMTGTVSTLDIYVDSRIDGTNYTNIVHFSQLLSATGPTAEMMARLVMAPGTPVEVQGLRADAGAGTVRNIGWGDDLRIRRDVSGGTTAPIFTYTVTVNAHS